MSQWFKPLLMMPLSHIRVLVPRWATLLLVQLPVIVPRKAADDQGAWEPANHGGRPKQNFWLFPVKFGGLFSRLNIKTRIQELTAVKGLFIMWTSECEKKKEWESTSQERCEKWRCLLKGEKETGVSESMQFLGFSWCSISGEEPFPLVVSYPFRKHLGNSCVAQLKELFSWPPGERQMGVQTWTVRWWPRERGSYKACPHATQDLTWLCPGLVSASADGRFSPFSVILPLKQLKKKTLQSTTTLGNQRFP